MTDPRISSKPNPPSAVGVAECTAPSHGAGPGSTPRTALHSFRVHPIPTVVAKILLVRNHYLHSLPGGTRLAFGVSLGRCLKGALTLGVGPTNAYRLVEGAVPSDCLTLTRLWLADDLPRNSETRVIGLVLRELRRRTSVKFVTSYSDPTRNHIGVIYQAGNWAYTGLSEAMPLYDLGDDAVRHSRSLSHAYGTHSVKHFAAYGVTLRRLPQGPKHRYLYFLDPTWRKHLRVPVLPYPKRKAANGSG